MNCRLLAITGGHRVDLDAFSTMVEAVCAARGWEWAHATQPAAQRWLRSEHVGVWDAILLHDIPGLSVTRGTEPVIDEPSAETRAGLRAMLDAGQGFVATHHALAGWPAWDEWAGLLGGRFLYAPGRLRGVDVPASGYRMATYRVEVIAPQHPVCSGVESFDVTDELYLCPVFEDEVAPLLATDAERGGATMIDTYREVRFGEQVPAVDQPGSRLLGWSKEAGNGRVVYLLPGHGPATMQHVQYRRLLANAVAWVAERQPR